MLCWRANLFVLRKRNRTVFSLSFHCRLMRVDLGFAASTVNQQKYLLAKNAENWTSHSIATVFYPSMLNADVSRLQTASIHSTALLEYYERHEMAHFCSGIHHHIHHQRVFGPVWIAFARRQGHQCFHSLWLPVDLDESNLVQRHRAMDLQGANEKCFSGEPGCSSMNSICYSWWM